MRTGVGARDCTLVEGSAGGLTERRTGACWAGLHVGHFVVTSLMEAPTFGVLHGAGAEVAKSSLSWVDDLWAAVGDAVTRSRRT